MWALPVAVKALVAQAVGWALAVALVRLGAVVWGGGAMLAAQAAGAVAVAVGLRSAPWWWSIHAVFSPLAWWASRGGAVAPAWWLAGFTVLALFYWSTARSQVPLYLSSRAAVVALAGRLPTRGLRVLDLGSGTGTVVCALARLRPQDAVVGVESAPALVAISRWRTRGLDNAEIVAGDFLALDWSGFDVVYAFLSPAPMEAVWEKARRELKPGAWLVSNSFAVPGAEPVVCLPVGREGMLQQVLLWYRPDGQG